MMSSPSDGSVILKEYRPLTHILQKIPRKAQCGVLNIVDIKLTAIDADPKYISIGSNIGTVFLYDRQKQDITRLKTENPKQMVTCVKLHSGLNVQIAFGTQTGQIHIFQLPSKLVGHSKELQRFSITDLHSSKVTCLQWSTNGQKLFSGDSSGVVVSTDVDFFQSVCKSEELLQEEIEVVQLDYSFRILLISTLLRTVICLTDKGNAIVQVGTKERRCLGNFGACFRTGAMNANEVLLYASRPGLRIWEANGQGVVQSTYIFKDSITQPQTNIPLLKEEAEITPVTSYTFARLCVFSDEQLISWNAGHICVLFPAENIVIATQSKLGHIADVAVSNNEVFVLRHNCEPAVIRIASDVESYIQDLAHYSLSHTSPGPLMGPSESFARNVSLSAVIHADDLKRSESPLNFLKKNVFSKFLTTETSPNPVAKAPARIPTPPRPSQFKPILSETDKEISHKNDDIKTVEDVYQPFANKNTDEEPAKVAEDFTDLPPVVKLAPEDMLTLSVEIDKTNDTSENTKELIKHDNTEVEVNNDNMKSNSLKNIKKAISSGLNSLKSNTPVIANGVNSVLNNRKEVINNINLSKDNTNSTTITGKEVIENIYDTPSAVDLKIDTQSFYDSKIDTPSSNDTRNSFTNDVTKAKETTETKAKETTETKAKETTETKETSKPNGRGIGAADRFSNIALIDDSDIVFNAVPKRVKKKRRDKSKKIDIESAKNNTLDVIHQIPSASSSIDSMFLASHDNSETSSLCDMSERNDQRAHPVGSCHDSTLHMLSVSLKSLGDKPITRSYSDVKMDTGGDIGVTNGDMHTQDTLDLPTDLHTQDSLKRSSSEIIVTVNDDQKQASFTDSYINRNDISSTLRNVDNLEQRNTTDGNVTNIEQQHVILENNVKQQQRNTANATEDNNVANIEQNVTLENNIEQPVGSWLSKSFPSHLEERSLSWMELSQECTDLENLVTKGDIDDTHRLNGQCDVDTKVERNHSDKAEFNCEGDLVEDMTTTDEQDSGITMFPIENVEDTTGLDTETPSNAVDGSKDAEIYDIYWRKNSSIATPTETSTERQPPPKVTFQPTPIPAKTEEELDHFQSQDDFEVFSSKEEKMDIWADFAPPATVVSMSLSSRHIWITDRYYRLYYSSLSGMALSWNKVDVFSKDISVSPSGHIVWMLYKDSAFAALNVSTRKPAGNKWAEVARQVSCISVDDNSAWYIKHNGEVRFQKNLTRERPMTKSITIPPTHKVTKISCRNGVVWALNDKYQLMARVGITPQCPEGSGWILDKQEDMYFSSVTPGDENIGWGVDFSGHIWFCCDVSPGFPLGRMKWWQVQITKFITSHTHEPTVMEKMKSFAEMFDPQRLASFLKNQESRILCANKRGVWMCCGNKTRLQVCRCAVTGHHWQIVELTGIASSATWRLVAAKRANAPGGMIWTQQPNGDIFTFPAQQPRFTVVQPPRECCMFSCISMCDTSVWCLTTEGHIFIRNGVTARSPSGTDWTQLDVTQLGDVVFIHLSCGGQMVWAVDEDGQVYHRIGTGVSKQRHVNAAWVPIDSDNLDIVQIYASENDWMVWALDSKKQAYARVGITDIMPLGTEWVHVPGVQASMLSVSLTHAWALTPDCDILCRYGIDQRNVVGDYWRKMPGSPSKISVSGDNDVWGINKEGHLVRRYTHNIQQNASTENNHSREVPRTASVQDDGEWELLG